MPPISGEDFVIQAALAGETNPGTATWAAVEHMTTFSKRSDRGATQTKVFGRATPWALAGAMDQGFSVSGLFDPADSRQGVLVTAHRTDAAILIRVLWDTGIGFTQLVKVTNVTHSTNADGFQEIAFEFTPEADAAAVGAGPYF